MQDNFEEGFSEYMTKIEKRMWFGVGAATLIIFIFLLWGIAHKQYELKSVSLIETIK